MYSYNHVHSSEFCTLLHSGSMGKRWKEEKRRDQKATLETTKIGEDCLAPKREREHPSQRRGGGEPTRRKAGGGARWPTILGGTMDWSQETYSVRWPLGHTIRLSAAGKAFAISVCIAKVESKVAKRTRSACAACLNRYAAIVRSMVKTCPSLPREYKLSRWIHEANLTSVTEIRLWGFGCGKVY
jgi:hypothetical protein